MYNIFFIQFTLMKIYLKKPDWLDFFSKIGVEDNLKKKNFKDTNKFYFYEKKNIFKN